MVFSNDSNSFLLSLDTSLCTLCCKRVYPIQVSDNTEWGRENGLLIFFLSHPFFLGVFTVLFITTLTRCIVLLGESSLKSKSFC